MARKQKEQSGLAKEIRRRQHDAQRRAEHERQALAAAVAAQREAHLEQIRQTLRQAAAAEHARRLLAEALAPTHAYGWQPWGYESPEFEPTQEVQLVRPYMRLVVTEPPRPRARARWDATPAHPHLSRVLAGAAA